MLQSLSNLITVEEVKLLAVSPQDVLTAIARSMMTAGHYRDLNEALRTLALAEVERRITKYRRRVERLRRKYGVSFDEFAEHLQGKATLQQEDDWFTWRSALRMLEDWERAKQELKQGADAPR